MPFCKWQSRWLLTPFQLHCKFKSYSYLFIYLFLLAIQSINSRALTIRVLRSTTPQHPISLIVFSFMAKPPQKRQQNLKDCFSHKNVLFFSFHLWHINKYLSCVCFLFFQASTRKINSRTQDKKTLWKCRWKFQANRRWLNLESGKDKNKNCVTLSNNLFVSLVPEPGKIFIPYVLWFYWNSFQLGCRGRLVCSPSCFELLKYIKLLLDI